MAGFVPVGARRRQGVDHGQPAKAHGGRPLCIAAFAVRPSVHEAAGHLLNEPIRGQGVSFEIEKTRDPTHGTAIIGDLQ